MGDRFLFEALLPASFSQFRPFHSAIAHSVTRNRTHESDFSLFSFLTWIVLNVVPRCFRVRFWQREHIDHHHWMGTISREVDLFGAGPSARVTRRTPCPSDLLGGTGGTGA
jgi:hypothetical protein